MMKKILLIGLLYLPASLSYSQKSLRDSLILELDSRKAVDAIYIDILNDLSFEFIKSDPVASVSFINKAIRLADSISYEEGLIRATSNKGSSFWVVGLQDEALSYYYQALSLGAERYPMNYARINNNIGEVFKKKLLHDSSMKYYREAMITATELLNLTPAIIPYNIGEAFLFQGEIDSALHYFKIGQDHALTIGDERGLAYSYSGLAEIHYLRKDFEEAFLLQRKALNIREISEEKRSIIQSNLKISLYHLSLSTYDSALFYNSIASQLSRDVEANDLLLDALYQEYKIQSKRSRYQDAAETLDSYQQLKDSIRTTEFSSNIDKIRSSLLAEISSKENQILLDQQLATKRINTTRILLIIVLFLGLLLWIRLINQQRAKKRLIKHKLERDLLINKLTRRNDYLEEFNSVVSHNLREPLTQIIGFTKFFESEINDLEPSQIIEYIKKSSFKIDQTIRDLSTVLNEKEIEKEDFKPLNLKKFVEEIVSTFTNVLDEIESEISIEILDSFQLITYKPFLHDIFHHLISNAIRFRKQDEVLSIQIYAQVVRNETIVSIKDNGIGLNMEKYGNKVFKMYQNFHPLSGKGIGLYQAKHKSESLGAVLQMKSEEGVGTTFKIRFQS